MRSWKASVAVLFVSVLVSGAALAQATRTWVSGVGDDANPCSRTAPCKTFAGAISKTAAGGEINVLDPGGYSGVTITKSISIEADGALAGVLVSGTNAIVINAGASDRVVLRGLTIEGLGTGLDGVKVLNAGTVVVDRCTINGFTLNGINFAPGAAQTSNLVVMDTTIRKCGKDAGGTPATTYGGIDVDPVVTSGASAHAVITRTVVEGNLFGIRARDGSSVLVKDSVSSNNQRAGFLSTSAAGVAADLAIEESAAVGNGSSGVRADGALAVARLSNVTTTANVVGMSTVNGGTVQSFGNNRNHGNATDGGPTTTVVQQ